MSCTPWIEQLGAFVDGELDAAASAALEAHLAGCPDCRGQLERQQWLAQQLAELPAVEPSPHFEAAFHARLARHREAGRERGSWLQRLWGDRAPLGWTLGGGLALGAAAAVALVLALRSPAPEPLDRSIVSDPEQLALLESEDLELLEVLDVLEEWDGSEEI